MCEFALSFDVFTAVYNQAISFFDVFTFPNNQWISVDLLNH